ncbi:hypothetical protein GGU10DRAFT_403210 [Lentinula aff. detonsa]|uniref:DUF6532 domain-containing protein n=1 Tax=Lentinula aff. detonsa TaxID=2804958 RepID=A0AA38KYP2_9AGAR|nr:hypothetical protein GGU10DRAFT_403210 [Lentinula aff. detonsa]
MWKAKNVLGGEIKYLEKKSVTAIEAVKIPQRGRLLASCTSISSLVTNPLVAASMKGFSSSVNSDNSKEIPRVMLGIVIVAIFAALKEWSEGCDQCMTQDFVSAEFSNEYKLHMSLIQSKIHKEDRSGKLKYHALMSWLYREARIGVLKVNLAQLMLHTLLQQIGCQTTGSVVLGTL